MARLAFDLLHPACPLLYFAALLVLAMTAMHPVFLLCAWAGSLACCAGIADARAAARSLGWQLGVVAVVALANCVFVSSGSTEIARIGLRAFYAEALAYGACSGLMLACVLQVFANASRVLSSDKVMAVLGRAVPTVALMTSMTMRLVPQFAARGRAIGDAARACTAAAGPRAFAGAEAASATASVDAAVSDGSSSIPTPRRARVRENMRLVTVLMGWGMEDALETADAMKARGWGVSRRRTAYARHRFRLVDAAACAIVALLAVASGVCAWAACSQLSFYPTLAGLVPWYVYVPFALFTFLPTLSGAMLSREAR